MRLSAQNNQFKFLLPYYMLEKRLEEQFMKLLVKNFIPYDSPMDYINSTLKEITMPSLTFDLVQQTVYHGKTLSHKESKPIQDKFANEIQLTFRAVDSYLNYYMLLQVLVEFYLNNEKRAIDQFHVEILDQYGDKVYTVLFRDCFFKGVGEVSLGYNKFDISEKTFTLTVRYNWIDVLWELDDDDTRTSVSIFEMPDTFEPGKLDR